MTRYADALERFRDELDSLNVYPVPDGDTGTNLLQTVRAVVRALDARAGTPAAEVSIADTIVRASLMGARGNSGVILAQTLRGLCDGISSGGTGTGTGTGTGAGDVAAALAGAAGSARRAVDRPREGTVLTVLDEAARAATTAPASADDPALVLARALEAARESLARTVNELPELRAAGVVDAGGKGAVLLLDALYGAVSGAQPTERPGPLGPVGAKGRGAGAPESGYGFEVQGLVEAPEAAVPGLRTSLGKLGESLAVVGGDGLFNVHVHTDRPDDAVAAIRAAGTALEMSVLSLDEQVSACAGGAARSVQLGLPTCAMVALAAGPGLAAAFRSLGASAVLARPGRAPGTSEIRAAVSLAAGRSVVVLPNDAALAAAARDACSGAPKPAAVVNTDSAPAGLAAATAFHPDATLETNESVMREAAERCRAGASSSTDVRALVAVAERLRGQVPDAQLLTLIAGESVAEPEAEAAADLLRTHLPDLEVQLVAGGQPGPAYVLGVE